MIFDKEEKVIREGVAELFQQIHELRDALDVAQVTLAHLIQDGDVDGPGVSAAEGALRVVNDALGIPNDDPPRESEVKTLKKLLGEAQEELRLCREKDGAGPYDPTLKTRIEAVLR